MNNELEVFKELNNQLKEHDIDMTLICVGGFILSHYGMRTTQDIDGFYETSRTIEDIIFKVGEKFHINTENENWLNNSVQNMNERPPENICETLYEFSNLKVLTPPLDYIAGMKLSSAREQDLQDVAFIIKKLKITSPDALRTILSGYGFNSIDESLILEAFGIAYGMDWLEQYYIDHEEEILKNIKNSI